MGNNGKIATRIHRVTVRFDDPEWKILNEKVSHTTHTTSEFIRRAVLGKRLTSPSRLQYGNDISDIFNQLKRLQGWTKNFYNETNGLESDLTRKLLISINTAASNVIKLLEEMRQNNKKERKEDEELFD